MVHSPPAHVGVAGPQSATHASSVVGHPALARFVEYDVISDLAIAAFAQPHWLQIDPS
jgi:hypothetical protein